MTRENGDDGSADPDSDEEGLSCPFCDSTDVVKDSDFGPEISKSQYYCRGCETPFERIKFGESRRPETGR
ncbi:PaaD-like zinc ribbon domain-containing protein [Halobaculum sp. EA56]|uniref:PaaD-like zinc ribbon domain-containing protein n=1 Tax=Halobaculum sp. EA56 TaxID=3421648 RepID=UPI003EB8378D